MYAVLGEDRSDVETLQELIFRIADNRRISIKKKGYSSCGEMLRKGARQLKAFHAIGCAKFIICYDSDRDCPEKRKKEIVDKVIKPSGVAGIFCALVPIQELEAWVLADILAVSNIITGWAPAKEITNPESIQDPKEYLEKLSRANQRPRYSHATHNPRIAKYLDLEKLRARCPSSEPLFEIIKNSKGNA